MVAESFGTGLKRIADACDAAGVKVEFQMLKMGFSVVFYRSDNSIFSDASIGDSVGNNVSLTDTQKQIIAIMKSNPEVSASTIAGVIGIAPRNVERNIMKLKATDIIQRDGATYGGRWVVLRDD